MPISCHTRDSEVLLLITNATHVSSAIYSKLPADLKLEKAAQPSAKYRPTRLVVDAALRRIRKSRHGGHEIANSSRNCERI